MRSLFSLLYRMTNTKCACEWFAMCALAAREIKCGIEPDSKLDGSQTRRKEREKNTHTTEPRFDERSKTGDKNEKMKQTNHIKVYNRKLIEF